MENKHFISWRIDGVNLNEVPDEVLMAHIRIVSHRLDKEMQYLASKPMTLSPDRLDALTQRLKIANERFGRQGDKPDLAWANYVHDAYAKALKNETSIIRHSKIDVDIPEESFCQLIKSRRSIRSYTDEAIPDDLLKKIVAYGLWAPSNCNVQAVRYIIVKDPETRAQLEINSFTKDMGYCTLAIIADYRFYPDADIDNLIHDSAAAIQNILLACHYFGVGACFVSDKGVNTNKRREALGIKHDYEKVTAFVWMGKHSTVPEAPARRHIDEVLSWK